MLIKTHQPLRIDRTIVFSLVLVCCWTFVIAISLILNIAMKELAGLLWATHAVIWLMGLAGLNAVSSRLRRRTQECDLAEGELRRVNELLELQATTDSITGICNRRKFLELLQLEIQESKRYGVPLVLIFFDIDHFKEINDNYGHEAGDSVLRELSRLVIGIIRQADIFARFGGEEFIILAHNNDVNEGCELAEKIRSAIDLHNFSKVGRVTCSFGVAQFIPGDTAESIIKRADEAMYSAKKGGRNLVKISVTVNKDK